MSNISPQNPFTAAETAILIAFAQGGGAAGSLAMEIPAGAVNGSNASFTVQKLPVFIEVSGATLVSNVADPTNYGFTITGTGPYTIVFSTAPANPPGNPQTPHSFHN